MDSNNDILTGEFLARHISGGLTPLEKIAFSEMLDSEPILEVKEIVSDLHHREFFEREDTSIAKIEKIEDYIESVEKFRELKSPDMKKSKII